MKTAVIGVLIIAVLAVCLGLSYWLRTAKTIEKKLTYGPFTIQKIATTRKVVNLNYGWVKQTTVACTISYKGQPIRFPSSLETNTGLPFLWKVYTLPEAPYPTLIAGSQSLYLISIKNGKVELVPLLEQSSSFASKQFLDIENGQPGYFQEIYMENDPQDLGRLDQLEGGRFLMIGEKVVLDVSTGKTWRFNAQNKAVDNYTFPWPHGALAFSPDQTSIVFCAEFQSWNTQDPPPPDSTHGLVVYNFIQDKGYVVPYSTTDTRMINVQKINQHWLHTFFEWRKDPNGQFQLQFKPLKTLPPWTGRYNPKDGYYTLYPVKAEMLPVFLKFVLQQMNWTDANILEDKTGEYTGRTLILGTEELKFDLIFKEDEQKLSFSKHIYAENKPEYLSLVKNIAAVFDKELLFEKHQECFGRIGSKLEQAPKKE
jgi:hypothetical protein